MGLINPTYRDRVKYTLYSSAYGRIVIPEPIGWKTSDMSFARNKKYHGIFTSFSSSLKFIGDAADFITLIYTVNGINEDIRISREERHPHNDTWQLAYSGYLDLSTYEQENNQVSAKINTSGLEKLLKSKESEKIEIERLDSLNGTPIEPLKTVTTELDGRRIFLETKYIESETDNYVELINDTSTENENRGSTEPIPLIFEYDSHDNAHMPLVSTRVGDDTNNRTENGDTGIMFFANSDTVRELHITLDITFTAKITRLEYATFLGFWCRLAHYENGSDYDFKENHILYHTTSKTELNNTHNVTFDAFIYLEQGDSLALVFDQLMEGYNILHDHHLKIRCDQISGYLKIEEDSYQDKSVTKTVLNHELGERILNIITDKPNILYSEALGRTDISYDEDGFASLTGHTHGHWVRGFDKLPNEEDNKYKPFTTSFKEYMEANTTIWNLGLGIETVGYQERIRIEDQSYFYNGNILIRLPNQVSKLKRSVAKDYYYSSLDIGYSKGGDYEEAMGLDEYNAVSTFSTIISRLSKVFKLSSKYRADSYGLEFARRKQKTNYPTEDTGYDLDVFALDLKRYANNVFKQRLWQDDFEQAPTGTFSPETATNLRFTPFNILLRHGWKIASGVTKYLSNYIKFASSTANSNLVTKLTGQEAYAENGDIIASKLKKAKYVPEWIEFEHLADYNVMSQVQGSTKINGKEIQNVYGLVEFINSDREKELGYLYNLNPNSGKWKLLKANK
ncbi:MAG: hypothetical protein ACPGRW_06135 [Flavobacteriaceae bacterium]